MIKNNTFFDLKASIGCNAGLRLGIEGEPVLARWVQALG
jgi:hypothetical protein